MTFSDVTPYLISGKSIVRRSSTTDRTIRYDRDAKIFRCGIQGVPDVEQQRRIDLSIDDLKARDWAVVDDRD